MAAFDHEGVRDYVLAGQEPEQKAPEGQVRLDVISSVLNGGPENSANNWKNFALTITIKQFKDKLYMFVGTAPEFQRLQLWSKEKGLYAEIKKDDDNATLGSYQPVNGTVIYVIDEDPNNTIANLTDTSKGEKYNMSEDSYNQRDGTYKKWKDEQKQQKAPAEKKQETPPDHIKIGDRCELIGEPKRRGEVAYIGELEGQAGYWVGVKLDKALGKNDGSLKGKRYFECSTNHGSFVKPDKLTVGDFPVEQVDEI